MVTNNAANNPTGASGKVLQGQGVGTASNFSTATYPATATGTGTILRADGTNWVATTATYPTTAGTSGNVLTSDGTNFASSVPFFIQQIRSSLSTVTTCSTNAPFGNTVPTTASGTSVMSVTITPKNSANILVVQGILGGGTASGAIEYFIVKTGSSNAVWAIGVNTLGSSIYPFYYYGSAGSTSALTFTLYCGVNGFNFYTNADSTGAASWGVPNCYMLVTEYSS